MNTLATKCAWLLVLFLGVLGPLLAASGCRVGVVTACHDVTKGRGQRDLKCNGHCCVVDGQHRVYYAKHECTCSSGCPCREARLYGR